MRWVATSSIALAALLILIPWQICVCGAEGPNLELLWGHAECPAPASPDSGEPDGDPDCDTLFTFDAHGAAGAPTLASPEDAHDVDLDFLASQAAHVSRPFDGPQTRADPPDPRGFVPHAALVTRLLI